MSEARSTRWTRLAVVVSLVVCAAMPARGQTIRGTMTGTVTDSTGAVVPGMTVTVTHTATASAPGRVGRGQGAGRGWAFSAITLYHSGDPLHIRVSAPQLNDGAGS